MSWFSDKYSDSDDLIDQGFSPTSLLHFFIYLVVFKDVEPVTYFLDGVNSITESSNKKCLILTPAGGI